MIFGTAYDVSQEANTTAEVALSKYMMKVWATFARCPADGLKDLGWPEYSAQGMS